MVGGRDGEDGTETRLPIAGGDGCGIPGRALRDPADRRKGHATSSYGTTGCYIIYSRSGAVVCSCPLTLSPTSDNWDAVHPVGKARDWLIFAICCECGERDALFCVFALPWVATGSCLDQEERVFKEEMFEGSRWLDGETDPSHTLNFIVHRYV